VKAVASANWAKGTCRTVRLLVGVACLASLGGSAYAAEGGGKSSRPTSAKEAASPSDSEPPIDRAAAKAAFHEGLRAFNLGQWGEAVAAFEKSYKLSGDPALLFNVAQAQRLAGHRKEALIAYKAYLRENPDTPHRELVESKIRELEASVEPAEAAIPAKPGAESPPEVWVNPFDPAAQTAAPDEAATETVAPPSAEAAETAPPEKAPPQVAPLPASAPPPIVPVPAARALLPAETSPAPVADAGSSSNRWWLWTGIGAVVAAGVVTALLLSTPGTERDGTCPAGLDGCLTVGK
jgi:hypothetical protein